MSESLFGSVLPHYTTKSADWPFLTCHNTTNNWSRIVTFALGHFMLEHAWYEVRYGDSGDCVDIETSCLVFGIESGYVPCWLHYYIVYITLSRMIVLYSKYKVNQGTNMSVVLNYVILFFVLLLLRLGSALGIPNLWGAFPLCRPLHNIWFQN